MTDPKPLSESSTLRVVGPEIAMGDERERTTFTEGGTVGMYSGMYLSFVTALIFALFGHILVPFVLLVLGTIPAMTALSYAQKRGVDAFAILARTRSIKPSLSGLPTLAVLLLMCGAMLVTTTTGSGMLEFELSQAWSDRLGSVGQGAAVGAGIGALLGFVGAAWTVRRRRQQQDKDAAEPQDED